MTWEFIFTLVTGTLTGLALGFATVRRMRTAATIRNKKLEERHAHEMIKTAAKWYRAGWDNATTVSKIDVNVKYGKAELSEPALGQMVTHCNERTGYEFIMHPYDPDTCEHCLDVRQVVLRSK